MKIGAYFGIFLFFVEESVPQNSVIWKVYKLLAECIDIVFAPIVHKEWTCYLEMLTSEFYAAFLDFAPDLLKPKFHFFIHYCKHLLFYGPLRHRWCMRYESFHRRIKNIAIQKLQKYL